MKLLNIHFRVGGYCSMNLEVPDDYEVPSTHPGVFWKDLCKRYRKQVETDIMKCKTFGVEDEDLGGFYIDQMVLDYFQKVYIHEDGGKVTEINLEHIPFHK